MSRVLHGLIGLSLMLPTLSTGAQDPKTTTREVMTVTAKVDRINHFPRSLVLRTPEGLMHTVYVEPTLKLFDELKTGDMVTVRIVESVVVAVNPNARPTVIADTTAEAKKESADGREVQQQLKATVTIESVDVQKQIVTYRTADNRSVIRQVSDPGLLQGLKKGDVVEVTLTRERAIDLKREP